MRYLGIDFGAKRVGTAVSDDVGAIAFPRATLTNDDRLVTRLVTLVEQEKIQHIIIGDTHSHGGASNSITAQAEHFIEDLRRATSLPIDRAFEAWSSIEASRYAPKGHEHDDAAAAAIILQRFLDMGAAK